MVIDHMLISKYKYESKVCRYHLTEKSTISQCSVCYHFGGWDKKRSLCVYSGGIFSLQFAVKNQSFHHHCPFCTFSTSFLSSLSYTLSRISTLLWYVTSSLEICSFIIIIICYLKCFCNLHQKHGKKLCCHHFK